jgi:hypothetical protein
VSLRPASSALTSQSLITRAQASERGRLAYEALGFRSRHVGTAQQIDRRRANLHHDRAGRKVAGLREHRARVSGGAQGGVTHRDLARRIVEGLLQAADCTGQGTDGSGHRDGYVFAKPEGAHDGATERLDIVINMSICV